MIYANLQLVSDRNKALILLPLLASSSILRHGSEVLTNLPRLCIGFAPSVSQFNVVVRASKYARKPPPNFLVVAKTEMLSPQ